MSERPLRVFSIAHPAIKCDSGRLRYDPLAARTDLDLHLLVPSRWHQFGRVMTAETSASSKIQLEIAPIALPKAGPLSWYLHFYPGLRRLLRRLDPDVVHLWEEPWSVVALQACLLKGRAALVLEVDQNIVKRLPPPFEALRRFVLRRTAMFCAAAPMPSRSYAPAATPGLCPSSATASTGTCSRLPTPLRRPWRAP